MIRLSLLISAVVLILGVASGCRSRPSNPSTTISPLTERSPQTTDSSQYQPSPTAQADYAQLENLLKTQQWKAADQETGTVMQKIDGSQVTGLNAVARFPCKELQTIDQLWVNYSGGRFGFSVQKSTWASVGGTPDATEVSLKDTVSVYERFADRVGWKKAGATGNGAFIAYDDLTYSANAPIGHLPSMGSVSSTCGIGGPFCLEKLLARWYACAAASTPAN